MAWRPRVGGAYLAAADYAGEAPREPGREELDLLAALDSAAALLPDAGDPGLARLAERHGASAAAPVRGPGGELLAALLVGGAGAARPRVAAALERAARGLARALGPGAPERDARHQERLAALGRLAAEIAHEVRNPLVSVKTFVQLLPEHRDDPEFMDRFLAVVGDELRRMERLLDRVIDQGRPPGADGEATARVSEALAAVGELVRHRAASAGISLETRIEELLPDAAIPPDELRQVLLNLVLNAVDATPRGGTVSMVAEAGEAGRVRIRVRDQGPGLPAELGEALQRGFGGPVPGRAGRPGGLGLAITRRIVEDAGGSIEARDREQGGAEFCVGLRAR